MISFLVPARGLEHTDVQLLLAAANDAAHRCRRFFPHFFRRPGQLFLHVLFDFALGACLLLVVLLAEGEKIAREGRDA